MVSVDFLPQHALQSTALLVLVAIPAALFLYHLVPFVIDSKGLRSIPGPFLAKLTEAWFGTIFFRGNACRDVYGLHEKYGTFVRLAPNHVSISSPAAIPLIYGHSAGLLKSSFYDAFMSFKRGGIFSTRSRAEHARKRRIISHMFAPRSVRGFEARVKIYMGQLLMQWDALCDNVGHVREGKVGSCDWNSHSGMVWLDCMPWLNFLTFDIIGELAFGAPFGMLLSARDSAQVPKSREAGMAALENTESLARYEEEDIPAVATINGRGDLLAFLGTLPGHWRPIVKSLPMFKKQDKAAKQFPNMAVAAIARRLNAKQPFSDKKQTEWDEENNMEGQFEGDMLAKLLEGKDESGEPMGAEELCAEALTLLVAGSDTTSNSAGAIIYYVARDQRVQAKLQAELDGALGSSTAPVADLASIEHLPYLEAVVNESLRVHSTLGMGLPRVVPEGGMEILGQYFQEGTEVSVCSYVVHRDTSVWGADVEAFRPERWLEGDADAMQKAFIPFSVGPRACVGRNLAKMELLKLTATIFKRYRIVLEDPNEPLRVFDALLRRPMGCRVGMMRRDQQHSDRKDAVA